MSFDPVLPEDLSTLFNRCTGPGCSFCAWRMDNPIDLGWKNLLSDEPFSSNIICGVELTASQVADPTTELSMLLL